MMILKRSIIHDLIKWRNQPDRKPLLLRGARQVGKSFLTEYFGKSHFENVVTINFELEPAYKACFNDLQPAAICQAISAIAKEPIVPGQTLLFLDEIQDCPQAIMALRYFKEKLPELHVIGGGSLLELALRQAEFKMPVGRVSFLYLYPLSFKEYLANLAPETISFIENATVKNPMPEAIHQLLLKHLKQYFLIGGLPEAVSHFQAYQDINEVKPIQSAVVETYEKDFGHYQSAADVMLLQRCFKKIPRLVGQQIKYNKLDAETRSRDLKEVLNTLEAAHICYRIQASSAVGLPLDATLNEKKFKLNFIDVGLLQFINQIDTSILFSDDIMQINNGGLAEQFVGQELLAYSPSYRKNALYFWARDGSAKAELDYVITVAGKIIPIEVKAGRLGRLRSLHYFMETDKSEIGVRISQAPLSLERNILSVPLYMVSELERLIISF